MKGRQSFSEGFQNEFSEAQGVFRRKTSCGPQSCLSFWKPSEKLFPVVYLKNPTS